MRTIFKLIDDVEKNDIQKNKRISLSRPLLSFGEPEGLIVDFFRDINKLVEKTQNILSVKPTDELLYKIREWHEMYYGSLPDNHKTSYSDYDIKSDLRILMCIYFQTYCGYFTNANLECSETRKRFFDSNKSFIEKYNKTAILKINTEQNNLDCIPWEYIPADSKLSYTFSPSSRDREGKNNILAALHLHDVVYLNNNLSASDIFTWFNCFEDRSASCWFKYSIGKLKSQQEKRLMFYLPSYEINSWRAACENIFIDVSFTSLEEALFYYAVSTLKYAKDNFPKFVYLKIKDFEITNL